MATTRACGKKGAPLPLPLLCSAALSAAAGRSIILRSRRAASGKNWLSDSPVAACITIHQSKYEYICAGLAAVA